MAQLKQVEMNVFDQMYQKLAALPPENLAGLLQEMMPPQEIFARMEGSLFVMHFHGLRMFDLSADLFRVGIQEDDPRAEIFHQLQGGLVEKRIINGARAIVQREHAACKNAGGVMIWVEGKRGWWVPVIATSKFVAATDQIIQAYADFREKELIQHFSELRERGHDILISAAEKAWNTLRRERNLTVTREGYMEEAEQLFQYRFPTEEGIQSGFHATRDVRQKDVPSAVRVLLTELREAERVRLEQETARDRETARFASEQASILQIQNAMEAERVRRFREENELREKLISEAMAPEIQKAKAIAAQFYAGLIKTGNEILEASRKGQPIHHKTRERWQHMIETMGNLEMPRTMQAALDRLMQTAQQIGKDVTVSPAEIQNIEGMVRKGLEDFGKRVQVETNAAGLWELVRNNRGEKPLKEISEMRAKLKDTEEDLESLLDLMTETE